MRVLPASFWMETAAKHADGVDRRVAGHLARSSTGAKHPVEDFLFTYYRLRPAALRRWHPGVGLALSLDGAPPTTVDERAGWRWYRRLQGSTQDVLAFDAEAFVADRRGAVRFIHDLLRATGTRPVQLGCLGLHEWAMIYAVPEGRHRHQAWPLRLGPQGTDAVVRSHRIACSHFDAFRFFTPEAAPRNLLQPTRSQVLELEQPGCLHAAMDLYKWCYQLGPAVPSSLLLACFDLAREVRVLDMQASPYDLADLGCAPVAIETSAGKAEYVHRQRSFSEQAAVLRAQLVEVCEVLAAPVVSAAAPRRAAARR